MVHMLGYSINKYIKSTRLEGSGLASDVIAT